MAEGGSSALYVSLLHTALPSKNETLYTGKLSLNKYSNVEMIYHSYLTNQYFPCLIDFIFKQSTGPSSGLKASISTSHGFTMSHTRYFYKIFLTAQQLESRDCMRTAVSGCFFFLFKFFFLMTVSNLQFRRWSFDLFLFIFYILFHFIISFHVILFHLIILF